MILSFGSDVASSHQNKGRSNQGVVHVPQIYGWRICTAHTTVKDLSRCSFGYIVTFEQVDPAPNGIKPCIRVDFM